jgi:hypothetical protein
MGVTSIPLRPPGNSAPKLSFTRLVGRLFFCGECLDFYFSTENERVADAQLRITPFHGVKCFHDNPGGYFF